MSAAYAERTHVPAQRSRMEVEHVLTRAGASAVAIYNDAERAAVAFRLNARAYRFVIPLPAPARSISEEKRHAQLVRQRWRALLLVLRAKIESARSGVTTLETELLPYAVLPSGNTVADEVHPRLTAAYESAHDVPLLPGM